MAGRLHLFTHQTLQLARMKMNMTENVRILCPIDFDVNSLAALDLARELVCDYGGTLYVLHVVPAVTPLPVLAPLLVERARHFARIRLEEIARESLSETDYRLIIRLGHPADQIMAAARELTPRMIVIATRGHAAGSRSSLGGVAERVICACPCPVLTTVGPQFKNLGHNLALAPSCDDSLETRFVKPEDNQAPVPDVRH